MRYDAWFFSPNFQSWLTLRMEVQKSSLGFSLPEATFLLRFLLRFLLLFPDIAVDFLPSS